MRLRGLRSARGLTQQAVAQRAGISENTYQLYESGRSKPTTDFNPTLDTLLCLAAALETTPSELLDIDLPIDYDASTCHAPACPEGRGKPSAASDARRANRPHRHR